MKLCPVAIAVGCRKCPIFTVCPAKGIIGDGGKAGDEAAKPSPAKEKGAARRRKGG